MDGEETGNLGGGDGVEDDGGTTMMA